MYHKESDKSTSSISGKSEVTHRMFESNNTVAAVYQLPIINKLPISSTDAGTSQSPMIVVTDATISTSQDKVNNDERTITTVVQRPKKIYSTIFYNRKPNEGVKC